MYTLTARGKGSLRWWYGCLLVGALLLAGCGTSSATSGNGASASSAPTATATKAPTATATPVVAQVKIGEKSERYSFAPATLTVAKGTKVVWTNASDAPHTVTSDTGATLASSMFGRGDTFSFIFTQPGTYSYHCTLHPYMKGTIVVTG